MLSFLNIKKINNSSFPIVVAKNFISKSVAEKFKNEIAKVNNFDDLVMNGRYRLNKGSKNFNNFIARSKDLKKFYSKINTFKFYKELSTILEKNFKHEHWAMANKIKKFSKINYGLQKGKKLTRNLEKKRIKNTLNLDIDFSASENGYFRAPHIDRETRIINFLLYLNDVKRKEGGQLEIYDIKNKKKNLGRFPEKKYLKKISNLPPVASTFIFFKSTPNSYHGVSRFKSINKRIFLYGSFSLNNKVVWKKNSKF